MPTYGFPLYLEDMTGALTGSDFVDIHDRMRLSVRCTLRDAFRTVYMIYGGYAGGNSARVVEPAAVLDYGPSNALGTVTIGAGQPMPMGTYLAKVSRFGRSARRFVAADGQAYVWKWRAEAGAEWSCTSAAGAAVADYSLRTPGESYARSSGCVLTVEEAYQHLAAEFLASLLIMRHIYEHRIC
ncbi:hypothetical protein K488DRAFT_63433 [Vararia minispora EC-137]|uniref:Uncharacterized protein n=1 Tax=Vararia minispora EC-137 TaxID=1314806 RepID=A0ACB8Q5Z0_9AGAM|nr:hypothetical protein K488DRAFT_63433 [Vararia minispora EC-137]